MKYNTILIAQFFVT